jgi:hypothetical protein
MKSIIFLSLTLYILVPSKFNGQSKQTQQSKVDSSLICINATINAVRVCCLKIITEPPYKDILISSKYPLIINFDKLADQPSNNNEDYVSLGNFDNIQVSVHSKTSLMAVGNVMYGMDFSGGSFNGGGYIESGEYEYTGGLLANGKQISFENAKIRYEDSKGLWKINEGAKCIIGGKEYYYKGGKWITQIIK